MRAVTGPQSAGLRRSRSCGAGGGRDAAALGSPAWRDTAALGRTGGQAREETLAGFPAAHPSQHGPREVTDQRCPLLRTCMPGAGR